MVNGRLRCLGSSQHLKHRYGNGFEVNIKILSPSDDALLALFKEVKDNTTTPIAAIAEAIKKHKIQGNTIASFAVLRSL